MAHINQSTAQTQRFTFNILSYRDFICEDADMGSTLQMPLTTSFTFCNMYCGDKEPIALPVTADEFHRQPLKERKKNKRDLGFHRYVHHNGPDEYGDSPTPKFRRRPAVKQHRKETPLNRLQQPKHPTQPCPHLLDRVDSTCPVTIPFPPRW